MKPPCPTCGGPKARYSAKQCVVCYKAAKAERRANRPLCSVDACTNMARSHTISFCEMLEFLI